MKSLMSLRETAEAFCVSQRLLNYLLSKAGENGLLASGALACGGKKWLFSPPEFRLWLQEQARQRIEARGRRPRRRKAGAR